MSQLSILKKITTSILAGGLVIGSLAVFSHTPLIPSAHAAACSTGIGSVTSADFTLPAADADTYRPWLELKGTGAVSIAVEIDGTNCFTQQTPTLNTNTYSWVAIGAGQALAAGTHRVKVVVYTAGTVIRNGVLVNNGCAVTSLTSCKAVATVTPTATATTTPVRTPTPTVAPTNTATPTLSPTQTPIVTVSPSTNPGLVQAGTWDDTVFSYSSGWFIGDNGNGTYNKYMGSDHYSTQLNATATLNFKGTALTLYGAKAPWHGKARIQVDGQSPVEIDLYDAARTDGAQLFTVSNLTDTNHTLTVTVLGTKRAESAGTSVALDKVVVGAATTSPDTSTPTPVSNPASKTKQ